MLFSANMPDSFWAEAAVVAAYIWNRLPSSAIEDTTPYERWFNKLRNYDKLRPFGCIVYAHIPKQRQPKFSKHLTHATKGCFIGYESSTPYKYWDFEKRRFDISHDIIFKESEFPTAADFAHNLQTALIALHHQYLHLRLRPLLNI